MYDYRRSESALMGAWKDLPRIACIIINRDTNSWSRKLRPRHPKSSSTSRGWAQAVRSHKLRDSQDGDSSTSEEGRDIKAGPDHTTRRSNLDHNEDKPMN